MVAASFHTPADPAPLYGKIVEVGRINEDEGRWVLLKGIPPKTHVWKLSPKPGFTIVALTTSATTYHTETLTYDPSWEPQKEKKQ